MEIAAFLFFVIIGMLASLVVSLLTKFISDKAFFRRSKIKIGGVEFQLSESADESTRRIIDKVQELQKSPQVFLSYSFHDKEFAQHLATDLRKEDVKVWLTDEQIKVGDRIKDTIRNGISSSQWVIIILSKNSSRSDFISIELSFALDEEQKRDRPFILPILIDDTKLPIQLQDKQYADFRKNYELGLERILARIKPSTSVSTQMQIGNEALPEKTQELFLRDPLTGVHDRRSLMEYFDQQLPHAKRDRKSISVFIVDIDKFRMINDTYGHAAGDFVLQSLGKLLNSYAKNREIIGHMGGHEFAVILPGTTLQEAQTRAEQLRVAFEELAMEFNLGAIHPTVSIGLAAYPIHGNSSQDVFEAANEALTAANKIGYNSVSVWGQE